MNKKQKTVLICNFFLSVTNTIFPPLLLSQDQRIITTQWSGLGQVSGLRKASVWTKDLNSTLIYPLGGRAEPTGLLNCVRKNFSEKGKLV